MQEHVYLLWFPFVSIVYQSINATSVLSFVLENYF